MDLNKNNELVLLYFLYQPQALHLEQLELSVLSWLKYSEVHPDVIVVTDRKKEFFSRLPFAVKVETLSDDVFLNWMGPFHFFWRIKICSIVHVLEKLRPKKLIYSDTDVVCKLSLKKRMNEWRNGVTYMNLRERKLSGELQVKENKTIWKKIKGKTFAGVAIDEDSEMWNAGVVGIKQEDKGFITDALRICDSMLEQRIFLIRNEQIALSLALKNKSNLESLEPELRHFWNNKSEWNMYYSQFTQKYDGQERLAHFSEFNIELPLLNERQDAKLGFFGKLRRSLSKRWDEMQRPRKKWG